MLQAGGNSGTFMTAELLKTGKHTVTAITRKDSQIKFPEDVVVRKVDYSHPPSIVEALKGQDAFILAIAGMAPQDLEFQLIQAASDAGVPWILPNEWSRDSDDEWLCKTFPPFGHKKVVRDKIASLPTCSYISVATGFWYEWSLSMPEAWGFDFAKKTVTFFDEGETKTCTSTWPQVGRAVAALLSLPIQPEAGDDERCLEHFRNRMVYIKSYKISQKDMLGSVLRVTGWKEEDWRILKEPAEQRYQTAFAAVQKGDFKAYARMFHTRVFLSDGPGDYEETKGTINDVLGLPKEDLDEATERAVHRSH